MVVKFICSESNHFDKLSKLKSELICRGICEIYNA